MAAENPSVLEEIMKRLDKLEIEILARIELLNDSIIELGKDIWKLISTYLELELGKHPAFWFDEEVRKFLEFEDAGDRWIIRPKGYLGSDTFAKVKFEISRRGGHYIPHGKDSYFVVRKWIRKSKDWRQR